MTGPALDSKRSGPFKPSITLCTMTMSRSQDLTQPLLAVETGYEASTPTVALDEPEPVPAYRFTWCDSLIVWVVLPGLLWLDFAMAFALEPETVAVLNWKTVNLSFVMFMIASYLYRKTIEDLQIDRVLVVLLPEIIMDAVLLAVLLGHIVGAFLLLLVSILFLASVVVINSVMVLCQGEPEDDQLDVSSAKSRVRSTAAESV